MAKASGKNACSSRSRYRACPTNIELMLLTNRGRNMLGENVAASRKASVESNRVRDQTIDCPIDGTLSLHRRKHTWTVFFDEASDLKGRVSDYSTIGIPHRKDEFLRQKLLAGGTSLSCRTEREKLLLLYRGSFDRRCGAFSIARNQFFDDDNDFSGDENCEMTSAEQYPSSDEFARCNNRRRNARNEENASSYCGIGKRERERERERDARHRHGPHLFSRWPNNGGRPAARGIKYHN
jgi:hypothetical protein